MSGVVAAVAGTAIVGGIVNDRASRRAADTAQNTSDAQLAYMRQAENRARQDINSLFPHATEARNQGFQQSMDLLGSALPVTIDALQQGSMGAQNVVAGSMPQMQNAILGGPIDYSFMQPQQVNVDIAGLLGGLPQLYSPPSQSDYTSPATPGGTPQLPLANIPGMTQGFNLDDRYGFGGTFLNQHRIAPVIP